MGEYKKRIKKYYDDFADSWDDRFVQNSKSFNYFLNKRLAMLDEYLGEYESLVDAGCGTGYYIMNLLKPESQGVGFDFSEKMIEQARQIKAEKFPDAQIEFQKMR